MSKKLSILFVLIAMCTSIYTHATNGYILLKTGEKIDVTIKISDGLLVPGTNFYDLQYGIKYYDKDDKKQKMKIALVKELYFKIDTNEYKMVCFKNTMKVRNKNYVAKSYVMLYEIQKGALSNYSYYYGPMYYTVVGPSMMHPGGNHFSTYSIPINADWIFLNVLQIEGKQPIKVTNRKFEKPILKYLATCKDVTTKIEKGTFGKSDLIKIVDEYNNECK
jgi:hypothetical protein